MPDKYGPKTFLSEVAGKPQDAMVKANPILKSSSFCIRDNKASRNAKGDFSTKDKCASNCIETINNSYMALPDQAKDVIGDICKDIASGGSAYQCKIEVEPFPIKDSGNNTLELYDFGNKKISVSRFADKMSVKPNIINLLVHETAHALDHKISINHERVDYKTLSHQTIVTSLETVDESFRSNHLNCLADLVDPTENLKNLYLREVDLNGAMESFKELSLPTEFLAFSFETIFGSIAKGENNRDFCTRIENVVNLPEYNGAPLAWAQETLKNSTEHFRQNLPIVKPEIKDRVGELYGFMLNADVRQAQLVITQPLTLLQQQQVALNSQPLNVASSSLSTASSDSDNEQEQKKLKTSQSPVSEDLSTNELEVKSARKSSIIKYPSINFNVATSELDAKFKALNIRNSLQKPQQDTALKTKEKVLSPHEQAQINKHNATGQEMAVIVQQRDISLDPKSNISLRQEQHIREVLEGPQLTQAYSESRNAAEMNKRKNQLSGIKF